MLLATIGQPIVLKIALIAAINVKTSITPYLAFFTNVLHFRLISEVGKTKETLKSYKERKGKQAKVVTIEMLQAAIMLATVTLESWSRS